MAGFEFSAPAAAGAQVVPEVFFADDGAFVTGEPRMLQLAFDVVAVMARLEGLEIGIKDDGSKTAWSGLEWRDGGWHDCGDGRAYTLLDGRVVPRNPTYKHLGTMLASMLDHSQVRERVVRRCSGVITALARLGVLNVEQYARASSAAVLSVLGYYGRATPIGRAACEQIEVVRRRALGQLGHRAACAPTAQVYLAAGDGGCGVQHCFATAAAALVDQVDRALCAPLGRPDRTAVEAAIAQTCVRLGWRPTPAAPTPLDWWPVHLAEQGQLSEDLYAEAWLLYRLEAGLRGEAAAAAAGAAAAGPLSCECWQVSGAPADALLWEVEGRAFGRRLAALGVARRRDVAMQSERRWLEWPEVERRFGGGSTLGVALRAEYDRLISALSEEEKLWVTAGPFTTDDDAVAACAVAAPPLVEVGEARHRLVGREALEHLVRRQEADGWSWERLPGRLPAGLQPQRAAAELRPDNLRQWLRQRRLEEGLQHAGQQPAEEELLAACQRAEHWLWLATTAPLRGDGEDEVEAAHTAAMEMARLLPTYASQERGDGRGRISRAAVPQRGIGEDRSTVSQRFYLGALQETRETRPDGKPRRRAVPGYGASGPAEAARVAALPAVLQPPSEEDVERAAQSAGGRAVDWREESERLWAERSGDDGLDYIDLDDPGFAAAEATAQSGGADDDFQDGQGDDFQDDQGDDFQDGEGGGGCGGGAASGAGDAGSECGGLDDEEPWLEEEEFEEARRQWQLEEEAQRWASQEELQARAELEEQLDGAAGEAAVATSAGCAAGQPQYAEEMDAAQRRELEEHPVLRLFLRTREMEQERCVWAGVMVDMEPAERARISVAKNRVLLRLLLALHERVGFTACYAVDGSHEPARSEAGVVSTAATAWGMWDGRAAAGGALHADVGIYRAELHAVRQALEREVEARGTGGEARRVLILSDCQPSLRAVERALGELRLHGLEQLRGRSGGLAIEAVVQLVLAIEADGGEVHFMYTPAHGGGISANAYADAIAKSHLSEAAAELRVRPQGRLCVYAVGGRLVDEPLFGTVRRLLEAREAERARGRGAPGRLMIGGARGGLWAYLLRRMSSGGRVSIPRYRRVGYR